MRLALITIVLPLLFWIQSGEAADLHWSEIDTRYYILLDEVIDRSPSLIGYEANFDGVLSEDNSELLKPSIPSLMNLTSNTSGEEPELSDVGVNHLLTASTYRGNGALKANFSSAYNSSAEIKDLSGILDDSDGKQAKEIFVSYYVNIEHISGDLSRNIKLLRLTGGYSGAYVSPMVGVTLFPKNNNGIFYNYKSDTGLNQKWIDMPPVNEWVRIDYKIKMSSVPLAADGSLELYMGGVLVASMTDIVTHESGDGFKWVTLPYYVAHDPGGVYNMYTDSLVIIPGFDRLEYCNDGHRSVINSYSDCENPIPMNPIYRYFSDKGKWGVSGEKLKNKDIDNKHLFYFDKTGELVDLGFLPRHCGSCPLAPEGGS